MNLVSTKNTMKDEKYSEDLEKRNDQKGKSTCIPGKESKTNCISDKENQKSPPQSTTCSALCLAIHFLVSDM